MILAKRTNDWLDLLHLPEFNWWQFLFAAVCLVVLIWSIVRFISRVHEDVDPAETDQDMLNTISELRREGDLSEDEYRSIKSQLMGRMSNAISGKQSKPNQSTLPVSLTEVPGSQHDTTNNSPGLVEPQAENGEESNENVQRDSD